MELKINEYLKPLYEGKFREYIIRGGRGSGKTRGVTQFLTIQALTRKVRILCLRQYSKSNRESLLMEFKDFLQEQDVEYNLKDYLISQDYILNPKDKLIKVTINEIFFKNTGSQILFTGINDLTVQSLKSISNISYAWVDEASFLTEYSYNILRPTIRAANSKLIFTFNPMSKDDFIYQKALNPGERTLSIIANYKDNAFFPEVMEEDRQEDFKTKPRELYNHIWEGEPLAFNDFKVIDTSKIGYFNSDEKINYDSIFISADTAFSKKENADYSVIGCFGKHKEELHLLRVFRGRWEFNELLTMLKTAYFYLQDNYKPAELVIIEKKASGISLAQELTRLTNFNIKEVTPKTDKFSRVVNVIDDLHRLRLPSDKTNPLNSWVESFLYELQMFRGDMQHEHDDQVDMLVYALEYYKNNKTNWQQVLNML